MLNRWYEIKVYKTAEDAGEENMTRILSHIEKFLFVICRSEDGHLRLFIRAKEEHRVTLDSMKGVEVSNAEPFDFAQYARYRRHSMRRHCAVPIIPKTMERISPYGTIYSQTGDRSFVAIYARKMDSAPPIRDYISSLERGQSPEGIMRFISGGGPVKRISSSARSKIKAATEKIETRSMFLCRIVTGAMSADDIKAIEGMFPVRAFKAKPAKAKDLIKLFDKNLALPMFGSSRSIILSDVEMLGFIVLPDLADLANINFDFGKVASESAGVRAGTID